MAFVWGKQPGENPTQSALASTVGSQQRDDLSFLDLDGNLLENRCSE
jgi:hypothetical protein